MEPLTLIIDDDPTGIQTVHGVRVCMVWSQAIVTDLFRNDTLAFIQTNNRARTEAEAVQICREIVRYAVEASRQTGRAFSVISRGDSTLRGHYPAEPETIRQTLHQAGLTVDGEILCFFLAEAGRVTQNNIHYIRQPDGTLTPVSDTEFARDAVFGYHTADLTRYVEEKTGGRVRAEDVRSLPLDWLESEQVDRCIDLLMSLRTGTPVVVNATTQRHVEVAVWAIRQAEQLGKRFVFRTAAAFVKAYGGITGRPLLTRAELQPYLTDGPVLTVVGSHTENTNRQLAELLQEPRTAAIEVDVVALLADEEATIRWVVQAIDEAVGRNLEPVVFTSRTVQKALTNEANLALSRRIATALSDVVRTCPRRPRAVVAKGGITSSDVVTTGLGIESALVLGQILPSIPVILSSLTSRFSDLPVVIFPGNTGRVEDLRTCWRLLS